MTTIHHTPSDDLRAAKVIEKDALLRQIKDLEFEHAVGKISDDDFAVLNTDVRERARRLLSELEEELSPFRREAQAQIERYRRQHTTQAGRAGET